MLKLIKISFCWYFKISKNVRSVFPQLKINLATMIHLIEYLALIQRKKNEEEELVAQRRSFCL